MLSLAVETPGAIEERDLLHRTYATVRLQSARNNVLVQTSS